MINYSKLLYDVNSIIIYWPLQTFFIFDHRCYFNLKNFLHFPLIKIQIILMFVATAAIAF
jgi:hypothetical protein